MNLKVTLSKRSSYSPVQLFINMTAHQKYVWSSGEKRKTISEHFIFLHFQDNFDMHLWDLKSDYRFLSIILGLQDRVLLFFKLTNHDSRISEVKAVACLTNFLHPMDTVFSASMDFLGKSEWSGLPFPSRISQPRDRTQVFHTHRRLPSEPPLDLSEYT